MILFLAACDLSPAEKQAWARDYSNGLHVRNVKGGLVYDVQYTPGWFVETNSMSSQENAIQQYWLEITEEGTGASIIEYEAASHEQLQQRVYYFSYQFEQDIYLEEAGVKLPCVLYHLEKDRGLGQGDRFVLGFEDSVKSDEAVLVIASDYINSIPLRIKISKKSPS
jgi:hypothetical protein